MTTEPETKVYEWENSGNWDAIEWKKRFYARKHRSETPAAREAWRLLVARIDAALQAIRLNPGKFPHRYDDNRMIGWSGTEIKTMLVECAKEAKWYEYVPLALRPTTDAEYRLLSQGESIRRCAKCSTVTVIDRFRCFATPKQMVAWGWYPDEQSCAHIQQDTYSPLCSNCRETKAARAKAMAPIAKVTVYPGVPDLHAQMRQTQTRLESMRKLFADAGADQRTVERTERLQAAIAEAVALAKLRLIEGRRGMTIGQDRGTLPGRKRTIKRWRDPMYWTRLLTPNELSQVFDAFKSWAVVTSSTEPERRDRLLKRLCPGLVRVYAQTLKHQRAYAKAPRVHRPRTVPLSPAPGGDALRARQLVSKRHPPANSSGELLAPVAAGETHAV